MGRHLGNNLLNLGIYDKIRQVVKEAGLDLDELLEQEVDPGFRQWGSRETGSLFLGFLSNPRNSSSWLRNSLRVRYLSPDN